MTYRSKSFIVEAKQYKPEDMDLETRKWILKLKVQKKTIYSNCIIIEVNNRILRVDPLCWITYNDDRCDVYTDNEFNSIFTEYQI